MDYRLGSSDTWKGKPEPDTPPRHPPLHFRTLFVEAELPYQLRFFFDCTIFMILSIIRYCLKVVAAADHGA